MALLAFRHILHLSVFENGLHFDFSAAGAEEFLGRTGGA
jgi:hypothetical protein